MKYPHILSKVLTTPWAIIPASFDGIVRAINGATSGIIDTGGAEDVLSDATSPGVAVIQVSGIIGKHLSALETMCGGCSIESIKAQFNAAAVDPSITDVVLWFDSPGGTVPGVPELCQWMRSTGSASGKTVYAFSDSIMASAAYWLACAADCIVCTPTATVGSIGVYCAYSDESEAYKQAGVKIDLIKAGKYKDMGSETRPMTDEERAMVQANVDSIHGMFKADVTAARVGLSGGTMEGQTFMGVEAQKAGLVDDIAQDFDDFMKCLQSSRGRLTQ